LKPARPSPARVGASGKPAVAAFEARRLRKQLAERDDLLAIAAHELRNPLHALSLQLALARISAQASAQADTTARIAKAQQLLARYVDRATVLLELARLDTRAYPLQLQTVDLCAVLRNHVESLAPEAQYRQVRLELDLPQHCAARTDPLVVEQVLDNLLLNAFKHALCSTVRLSLRIGVGDVAEIAVTDDGRGIAAADQRHVFAKFGVAREGPRGADTGGSGSGLGLWIVRKLVGVLGGAIALASEPGKGSRFTLTLPLSHPGEPKR
jgi:two-component system OmpR family sensor kinase